VVLLSLAVLTLLLIAATFAELASGGTSLRRLEDVPLPRSGEERPTVSVVVAARNEERNVEEALRSLLAQAGAGEGIEVIVVEDRSTDATGAILDRMAAECPALRVVHVATLPPGWLGKNHALWVGAEAARGELLLFTDADVVMAPGTIRRAAAHLVRERLDHLTLAPEVRMPGALLRAFGVAFGIFFTLYARPWKARDPRSRAHVGVGAFNLLRASAYRAMGTHRAIAMRPDDDMKLGKLAKRSGFRQELLIGGGMVSVEWYASLGEVVRGLEKNTFAGLDYRLSAVAGSTLLHLLVFVWPYVAVLVTRGVTQALYAVCVAILLLVFTGAARAQRVPLGYALLFPAASALFDFIVWNATLRTLARGGIEWRGTHYPLDALKANRV
jgi:cellulose synthase/poly-beta-1,6-N-acetylglucosamine synthase-like glycosyltransferase